jgi:hypothetical protein
MVEKVNLARAIVKIRENEIFALRKKDKLGLNLHFTNFQDFSFLKAKE